jgi:hypothetical protein
MHTIHMGKLRRAYAVLVARAGACQVKEDEMARACSTNGGEEECI